MIRWYLNPAWRGPGTELSRKRAQLESGANRWKPDTSGTPPASSDQPSCPFTNTPPALLYTAPVMCLHSLLSLLAYHHARCHSLQIFLLPCPHHRRSIRWHEIESSLTTKRRLLTLYFYLLLLLQYSLRHISARCVLHHWQPGSPWEWLKSPPQAGSLVSEWHLRKMHACRTKGWRWWNISGSRTQFP